MKRQPFTGLVNLLQGGAVAALVLGVLGATLPGDAGTGAGTAAVAAVVGLPLARVLWLSVRWARKDDLRYAGLAVVLLAVVGSGVALAA
jgi:hypothetical protein